MSPLLWRFILFGSLILPLILFIGKLSGCGGETTSSEETTTNNLPSEVTAAAELLLAKVTVGTSAEVTVVGPLAAGTTFTESVPEETGSALRLKGSSALVAVTLLVPSTGGTYYGFYIDDAPTMRFSHPVRYAWVKTEDNSYEVAEASDPPVISQPGVTTESFELQSEGTINGVKFRSSSGGGEANPKTTDSSLLTSDQLTLTASAAQGQCEKIALIVDGGDARGTKWVEQADNMASDADSVESYVSGNGFNVIRVSQYWDNNDPYFPTRENRKFEEKLNDIVTFFNNVGCENFLAGLCCHEFFLYIAAHGGSSGFDLYPKTGADTAQREFYEDIFSNALNNLPVCVKPVLLADVCESGGLITRNQTTVNNLTPFCAVHCGLTIMTSTDDSSSCSDGNTTDSATEDFMDGATRDNDKDGKNGDLRDRFEEMKTQGGNKSQLFTCASQTSLCSQD